MVNETLVDEHNAQRIQELEAINAELLEALEATRRNLEYNVPATEKNGKLLYSTRAAIANAKVTAR